MSDHQTDPSWWQADNDLWYPPEMHPAYVAPTAAPLGPTVSGVAGAGPASVADKWAKGAEGERATAAELDRLPGNFYVHHGLKLGTTKGDIDHLVIGPTGVWVIDTKNHSGRLTANKGMLWNGRFPIRKEIEGVERQADYASEVLGSDVSAVLCFPIAELPRPAQMVERTRVLSLGALVEFISSGPVVLADDRVATLAERAEQWKVRPPGIEPRPRSARRNQGAQPDPIWVRSQQPAANAPKPKRGHAVVELLAKLAVLIVALGLFVSQGPKLMKAFTDRLTHSTATPSTSANFTAQVTCPTPGAGYVMQGRAASATGPRTRVTVTMPGAPPKLLGEVQGAMPTPTIAPLAPRVSVGFGLETLDTAGQVLTTTHLDVSTPAAPC